MRNDRWLIRFGIWCSVFAAASSSAIAQAPVHADEVSCRRFVQAFYDWYAPIFQKRLKSPALDVALSRKPDALTPSLFRALKADSDAQSRTKGDVVGLDFDPFTGSQEPADRYEARRAAMRGNQCSVEIWSASPNDKAAKPDAVADLIQEKGRWQFANFRYPDLNTDLVSVLASLSEERRKH